MTTARQTPEEPAELRDLVALAQREHRAGRLAEAAAACRQILAIRPQLAEVHNDLGIILAKQDRLDLAAARFEQAVALRPGYTDAHINLGNVLLGQGRLDEAATHYRHALALAPDHAQAHYNLGNTLKQQGQARPGGRALRASPDSPARPRRRPQQPGQRPAEPRQARPRPPHISNKRSLCGQITPMPTTTWATSCSTRASSTKRPHVTQQALALRPDFAEAHYNLGNVLLKQGRLDEATARYEHALTLRPDYSDAHYNLGFILREQGQLDAGGRALRPGTGTSGPILPTHSWASPAAIWSKAITSVAGLPMKADCRIPGVVRAAQPSALDGPALGGTQPAAAGRARLGGHAPVRPLCPMLKQRGGARRAGSGHAALGRLLASHPDLDEFLSSDPADGVAALRFLSSAVECPRRVSAPTASTIPAEVPYLWADPGLTDQWRRELAAIDGFKIGIVWQGSRDYPSDRWRSIPLAQFAPLASLPGVRLISLQKGFGSEQIAAVDFPVLDLAARLDEAAGPFMDTAAVIRNLDLVVTVDTAIAHLAGALGAPVWLALQFSPDWRLAARPRRLAVVSDHATFPPNDVRRLARRF